MTSKRAITLFICGRGHRERSGVVRTSERRCVLVKVAHQHLRCTGTSIALHRLLSLHEHETWSARSLHARTCLRFSWFPRLFLVRVSYVRLVNTNSCEDVKDLFYWVVSSAATAVSSVNSHANKQAFASQTHDIAGVADDFVKKVDIRPKMCDPDSTRHYPEKMWLEAERRQSRA